MSPGLTNETVHLVHGAPPLAADVSCTWTQATSHAGREPVNVDLDLPENATPKQASEDESDIAVLRVPLSGLEAEMNSQAAAGVCVWNGLWALVAGMKIGPL